MNSSPNIINPFKIKSILFVPAVKKKFFMKIVSLEGEQRPHAIIFDLEDSVSMDFKEEARNTLLNIFKEKDYGKKIFDKYIVFIRVNPFNSKWFKEDIKVVNKIQPHFLMLSKVETPEEIEYVRKNSTCAQLFVAIETLSGYENRESILKEMKWQDLFVIGYEDLSAELLIERPQDLNSINPLTIILLKCIISARNHGILMVDAVSRKFSTEKDLQELRKECIYTSELGLNGKVAIHPNQIDVINKIFKNKLECMQERAEQITERFNRLEDKSFVIVNEKKEMMDTPSYKMYQKFLNMENR